MTTALDAGTTRETVVSFTADDGLPLSLVHVEGPSAPTREPVLLVHGAGVRANLFRPPTDETIVDALLDAGWDVWLLNWRASIDLPPNEWTLDEAALFDHPAAVRKVCELTGSPTIRAIVHCQGSTSFVMSAVAGLLPQVTTVVANAISLHPVLPRGSVLKMKYAMPVVSKLTPYLDPAWGNHAPTLVAKSVVTAVRMTHRECDNRVCRMVSFTYGSGFPALWRHENLNDATHEWLRQEFGPVPFTFFRQMGRSVRKGHLVSTGKLPGLPASYVAGPPQTRARFAFLTGDHNLCFLPKSQDRTFAFFDEHRPGYHALHHFEDYGHLDVFLGERAATDTFPTILKELDQAGEPTTP
jgi:pimeloyl-ACP methyl ester carboxylesterase